MVFIGNVGRGPLLAMINRILVCLDKSTYTDAAIDYACWLARHHAASLEGLVVLDVEGIERSVGAVPLGAMKFAKTSIAAKEENYHQLMETLLAKFSERCEAAGVRHTEFEMQGEPAEAILEESNYFDCVTIGFGLRNVTDKDLALRSILRVLKPGGRLLVLEFSKPGNPLLSKIYDSYSFKLLPKIGKLIAQDEDLSLIHISEPTRPY